jgi:hypothetical protein
MCDTRQARPIGDVRSNLLASKRRAPAFTQLAARSGVGAFIGCFGSPGRRKRERVAVQLYSRHEAGNCRAHAVRAVPRQELASISLGSDVSQLHVSGYGVRGVECCPAGAAGRGQALATKLS